MDLEFRNPGKDGQPDTGIVFHTEIREFLTFPIQILSFLWHELMFFMGWLVDMVTNQEIFQGLRMRLTDEMWPRLFWYESIAESDERKRQNMARLKELGIDVKEE